MTEDQRLGDIDKRIDGALRFFRRLSKRNQIAHTGLGTAQIVISAAIPILALVDTAHPIYAAIAGAIVATTKGVDTLLRPQETWLRAASTISGIYSVRAMFYAKAGEYATASDPIALFAERLDNVLSGENAQWQQAYSKPDTAQG